MYPYQSFSPIKHNGLKIKGCDIFVVNRWLYWVWSSAAWLISGSIENHSPRSDAKSVWQVCSLIDYLSPKSSFRLRERNNINLMTNNDLQWLNISVFECWSNIISPIAGHYLQWTLIKVQNLDPHPQQHQPWQEHDAVLLCQSHRQIGHLMIWLAVEADNT